MSLYNVLVDEIILYSSKVYANNFYWSVCDVLGLGMIYQMYNSDLYTFNKVDRLSLIALKSLPVDYGRKTGD